MKNNRYWPLAIAVVTPAGSSVRTLKFFGGRDMVKFQATQTAMNMLRLLICSEQSARPAVRA